MRRHLLLVLVAAAAVLAVECAPVAPEEPDSGLTPVDSADSAPVASDEAPGSHRKGRFLLLKLLAAKLLAGGAKKKAVAAVGATGVAGVAGAAGAAGLAGAGPIYVNGGLGGHQVIQVDDSVLAGAHGLAGHPGVVAVDAAGLTGGFAGSHGVVAVDGGLSGGLSGLGGHHGVVAVDGSLSGGLSGLGGPHGVVAVDGGLSGGLSGLGGSHGVVAVDGGLSGGLPGHAGVVAVDAGLTSGVSIDAVHAGGVTSGGVVNVVQVPNKVHASKDTGFFNTALKLPGLAVSALVDTASSTASGITSAAKTVFSLPVKAGNAIISGLDNVVKRIMVGDGHEYAIGESYVPNPVVYKETTLVKQPHHIILPIVVKGLDHPHSGLTAAGGDFSAGLDVQSLALPEGRSSS